MKGKASIFWGTDRAFFKKLLVGGQIKKRTIGILVSSIKLKKAGGAVSPLAGQGQGPGSGTGGDAPGSS